MTVTLFYSHLFVRSTISVAQRQTPSDKLENIPSSSSIVALCYQEEPSYYIANLMQNQNNVFLKLLLFIISFYVWCVYVCCAVQEQIVGNINRMKNCIKVR